MADYITIAELKDQAEADEASSDSVWSLLAAAVSRLFDRITEMPNDFFGPAPAAAFSKTFRTSWGNYLFIGPYISGTISSINLNGRNVPLAVGSVSDEYFEQKNYLVFNKNSVFFEKNLPAVVTARFGFETIPADIRQACIEQALFMWRRKDTAFTDMSGVATAAVTAALSPTFDLITKKYRELYSDNLHCS